MEEVTKVLNKIFKLALMMIKKEDHNTGVSNGVKKVLIKNIIKNLKNGTL